MAAAVLCTSCHVTLDALRCFILCYLASVLCWAIETLWLSERQRRGSGRGRNNTLCRSVTVDFGSFSPPFSHTPAHHTSTCALLYFCPFQVTALMAINPSVVGLTTIMSVNGRPYDFTSCCSCYYSTPQR